ncbi:Hsp20/alpha crystallin family protein [Danxiaibacter flavus]|uniref:Hsp20/alpha crystallin family protein n=1 Tax=Danxiaibacter flavus TaxID=3049108 RepID=A0ABV3ZLY2_9BACT|nr:Hsp20/alpha crystallin family protein [Chitinophagaceae bacterium DXS]
MATRALSGFTERRPFLFDDFFKSWSDWFDNGNVTGRTLQAPAVNITEEANEYLVSVAVPGMKKEDFNISVDGNMLTISSEKEDSREEADKNYTRKEYNYSSFTRRFNLPDEIQTDKIDASYTDGVLKISLPRNDQQKKASSKQIVVK